VRRRWAASRCIQAAEKVREKARELASHLLEVDADDLVFSDGRFGVKGVPRKALTIQQIAQQAQTTKNLPKGMEPWSIRGFHF